MGRLRLSDEQRRVLAIFIDSPPEDRLSMLSATAYLMVVSDHILFTLKTSNQRWEDKDLDLMLNMAAQLKLKSRSFNEDKAFIETVQSQLSRIHPDLKTG